MAERSKAKQKATAAMEAVTNAVNDELMQSLDFKMGVSNTNYVIARKEVQYFPSSLSTFTPTTSRVARVPLTSGADFIDPESVKIAFRVKNNSGTEALHPGSFEPSCWIKRVQLFANGQRTDDIDHFGRCRFLYSLLKPEEWHLNQAVMGHYPAAGVPSLIQAGEYEDVLMSPALIGLFNSGKLLPPALNLVLELEFAEAADAVFPGGNGSLDYSIENVRVLASQVTLHSALAESFNRVLLSGRSLVFNYPTIHTQVSNIPVGATSHNVTVARAFTKLLGAFVTFEREADTLGHVRNLEYPGVQGVVGAHLESQMQLGALQFPQNPMKSIAEHYNSLTVLAGTYDSTARNMRVVGDYITNEFIAAFPRERVPRMPLSGLSTRSGDLARFTFKNMVADSAQKIYIHLAAFQVVTLSGSGVSVLD